MRGSQVNTMLHRLRDQGYKVRVQHTRRYQTVNGSLYYLGNRDRLVMKRNGHSVGTPLSHGGLSYVAVRTPDGIEYEATAVCAEIEPFRQLLGTAVALGRVLHSMEQAGLRV